MDKFFLVKIEEMVDGEIFSRTLPFHKIENAQKCLNSEIDEFIKDSHNSSHYDIVDFSNAENDKTDKNYYIQSSCDDYYFDITIDEVKFLD